MMTEESKQFRERVNSKTHPLKEGRLKTLTYKFTFTVVILLVAMACQKSEPESSLKEAFAGDFYIGAALNTAQYKGQDERANPILDKHFNSITAENDMKWMYIHPQPDSFYFDEADQFVAFGEERGDFIIGHTLVWHSQTPDWVFEDENGEPLSREELLERMENHIKTVVGRYKGKVDGWDVVNEALNEDGTMRESRWYQIIGEDYVAKAFQFAHEADPDAELYYNDYNMHNPDKADGAVRLVKAVQDQGIRVTGIGMQGHWGLDYPNREQLIASIEKFGELGIVAITELDMDVLPSASGYQGADVGRREELRAELNPYTEGLPDSVAIVQQQQFEMFFEVFLEHADVINRVTTWGVTDGDSWKNGWPIPGRTNYPLLFNRDGKAKPVVDAIIDMAQPE